MGLASTGVGLGSLYCWRGSSGLFDLLGWLHMCLRGLKTGPVAGRPYSLRTPVGACGWKLGDLRR